jgi:hypothetical protein
LNPELHNLKIKSGPKEAYASPGALAPGAEEIHKNPQPECAEIGRLSAFYNNRSF